MEAEEEVPILEVPGWNGVVYPHQAVRSCIPLKASVGKLTADMAEVTAQITSESTAGAGFRFVAFTYPVAAYGDAAGKPLDFQRKGMFAADSFGTMVFQQVDTPSGSPLETKVVSCEMTISLSISAMGAKETGYDELYSKLQALGDEGYSLSAVIDDPNVKFTGLTSGTSPVSLIGQRTAGSAARKVAYYVQDVPIEIKQASLTVIKATMPTLDATLEEYFGPKRCKLASVYNPPAMQGALKLKSACHLIFEATDEPYIVHVVDTVLPMRLVANGVEYETYLTVVENFVAKGWELAAVIDMPDNATKGLSGKFVSSIKLLFQARSNQPGLAVAPAIPVDSVQDV